MSSGGQTTTQTTQPPAWLAQYGPAAASLLGGALGQPYNPYQGPQVAPLSGLQNQGLAGLQGLMFGNPTTWAANDYAHNTLTGGSVNPWTESVANRVRNQATDAYNSANARNIALFNRPGSLGSTAHEQEQGSTDQSFARGLGDALGGVYQQGFDADQARRFQAAQLGMGLQNQVFGQLGQGIQLGDIERQYGQSLFDAARGNFNESNNYPWQQLDRASNVAGRLKGGAGTQSTTQGPGPDRIQQGLGIYALGRSMSGSNSGSNKGGDTGTEV